MAIRPSSYDGKLIRVMINTFGNSKSGMEQVDLQRQLKPLASPYASIEC